MNLKEKVLLLLIVVLGLCFRIYGINFDQTCCQHPDERAIVMFTLPLEFPKDFEEFLSPQSPLNPRFFAYGNLPLYLLKGVSIIVGMYNPTFSTYGQMNLVGRSISVLAELATMVIIFLLARNIANSRVGLLSSFMYSISVLPIQYSHFFTSDILLTLFTTLTLFLAVKFYQKPSVKTALFLGVSFGLSLTTKISAMPLIASISFAIAADFLLIFVRTPHKLKVWLPHVPIFLKRLITEGVVIVIATLFTFMITQPYAIIDFSEFIKQNLQQFQMTHNAYVFPYTLQYVGKTPYIYEMGNLFFWGLGPIIAALSISGLILFVRRIKHSPPDKRSKMLIVVTFFIVYFAVVGNFAVGFMRYLLPVYPILAIFAAMSLHQIFKTIERTKLHFLNLVLKLAVLLFIFLWPLSFTSIYARANTRIEATEWINKNIPTGSIITTEHWDDRLPLKDSGNYNFIELNLYDQPDDEVKWKALSSKITQAEYLILASNRLYKPLQKLGECGKYKVCYPKTKDYYDKLFSGKLGFIKVAEFSSYPTVPFINLKINDEVADESFSVYDHPKVIIFKRDRL